MDISRPIASIVPLPPKRDDSNASFHSRNNAASRRDSDRVEAERDLATERQQSRPNPETAQNSNTAPIQFRDIQPTFISSREMKVIEHFPYSSALKAAQSDWPEQSYCSFRYDRLRDPVFPNTADGNLPPDRNREPVKSP
mgnify:CR=1 FL=1